MDDLYVSPERQKKLNKKLLKACKDPATHRSNIRRLLVDGAQVNTRNSHGKTPLMYACKKAVNHVGLLVDAGVDLSIKDNKGKTVLMYAIEADQLEVVSLFLEVGILTRYEENLWLDFYNLTPLMYLCKYNKIAFVKEFLSFNMDIGIEIQNNDGMTALAIAKEHDLPEVVTELINAGAIE